MAAPSTLRLGVSMGALATLQLLAGLALQLVVIAMVGAGPQTDAFVAAQTVPLLIVSILALPLASAWQPRMAVAAAQPTEFRVLQGLAQAQVIMTVGGSALLLGASASLWMPLLFPGFNSVTLHLSYTLTQILCVNALLNGQTQLLVAASRARNAFMQPEAIVAATAIAAVVMAILIVPTYGVIGAAWVSVGRAAVACAILHVVAGYPWPRFADAASQRDIWRLLRPLVAGSSIYKLSPLVDRYWASQAPAGGLTTLNLAQTGMGALAQVIERAVSVPVAPRLARLAASGDHIEMLRVVRQSIRLAFLVTAIILAVLVALRPSWVLMLGQVGLPGHMANQLWWISVLLFGFLHVAACGSVPVAAFIAIGDSRTPVHISIISFIAGLGLKSLGFITGGLPGLALATSIYYVGNLTAVSLVLGRRLHARN